MKRCIQCQRVLLVSFLILFGSVTSSPDDSLSSDSYYEDLKSAFCLKDRFKRALNLHTKDHERQKRFIHFRFKFPHETEFQLKWSIILPVPSEEKYESEFAGELEWLRPLPSYLADDEYEPPFGTLFNSLGGTHDEENSLTPGYVGEKRSKSSAKKSRKKKKKKKKKKKSRKNKRSLHVVDRLGAYEVIEEIMTKAGLPARACLQRTVCEVAAAPLHYGLLGDVLNLLLTPSVASLSAGSGDLSALRDYLDAEAAGRQRGECGRHFAACPSSVFDMVPLIRHTILDFGAF